MKIYNKEVETLNESELDLLFIDLSINNEMLNPIKDEQKIKDLYFKRLLKVVECSKYDGNYSRTDFNVTMDLFIPNPNFNFVCQN